MSFVTGLILSPVFFCIDYLGAGMNPRILTLLLFCFTSAFFSEDTLEKSVHLYWDALTSQDKASALQQVHPEDQNDFISRRNIILLDWKLDRIEHLSPTEAIAVVTVTRQFNQSLVKEGKVKNSWEKTDQGWKVRVLSTREAVLKTSAPDRKKVTLDPHLVITPKEVRFFAISKQQPGIVYVKNGLQVPIQVLGLEFDKERFELIDEVDEVAAGTVERIRLRFIGEETEENLKSEVTLRIRQSEEVNEYTISIVYNFTNDLIRKFSKWHTKQKEPQ